MFIYLFIESKRYNVFETLCENTEIEKWRSVLYSSLAQSD